MLVCERRRDLTPGVKRDHGSREKAKMEIRGGGVREGRCSGSDCLSWWSFDQPQEKESALQARSIKKGSVCRSNKALLNFSLLPSSENEICALVTLTVMIAHYRYRTFAEPDCEAPIGTRHDIGCRDLQSKAANPSKSDAGAWWRR